MKREDLEKLAIQTLNVNEQHIDGDDWREIDGFIEGYTKAQRELFTSEEMEKAIEMARVMVSVEPSRIWAHETHSIIQSLKESKNEKST